jgi:protein-tyrosine phosphatase
MSVREPCILYVCLGNVCRSPMAESVTRRMLMEGFPGRAIRVESRGTAGFNSGKPADPRAMAALSAHGYVLEGHVARQISDEDFLEFDHIIAMDRSNLHTLSGWSPACFAGSLRLLPGDSGTGSREVPDPFYGDPGQFERVLGLLERGIRDLLNEITGAPMDSHA